MGVEKAKPAAAQQVGLHQVQEQPCLAGAGLSEEGDVPSSIRLQQRHALAGRERAELNCL